MYISFASNSELYIYAYVEINAMLCSVLFIIGKQIYKKNGFLVQL